MILTQPYHTRTKLFENLDLAGLYLNGAEFLDKIIYPAESFKAITFTCDASILDNCSHVIACKMFGDPPKKTKVKILTNVHTKLYIIKGEGAWVGSLNLREAAMHNIMIEAPRKSDNYKLLVEYFDALWRITP